MAEAERPRHADEQLDQAALHAARLIERAMSTLPSEALQTRFAQLTRHAAQLRDASGDALRKSAVATRSTLGSGDGLASFLEPKLTASIREAIDDVLRILNRRAAHHARPARRGDL